jgi:hypothetical protein
MTPNLPRYPLLFQALFATRIRRVAAWMVIAVMLAAAATGGVWAAFQSARPVEPQLAAMLPQGALLTIEAKDFAGLLRRWNDSPEKSAWLKSDNLSVFSRSRLFGRLGDAQNEFAEAAGLPPDMSFLNEVAGTESVFAWYDIGKLEFLYITRMPSGSADKTRLVQMRGKFATRQAAGQTFYVRTQADQNQAEASQGQARTVAFATSGDWLLLATREDLMAGALTLMGANSGNSATGSASPEPLSKEPWFVDARAAAAKDGGELRMTLNLEKIVPSPYFRSYWVQRNITEMKQYRSAVADLFMDTGDFREERVLLPRSPQENAASATNLDALTALLPQHAGVYRAVALPGINTALDSINEKLLQRGTGGFSDMRVAPDANVSVHEVGSAADLETRIDAAPLAHPARDAELAALRQTLADSDLQAMMTLSRTGDATQGIWVPFQSAVVLSGAKDWDVTAMQSALQQALRAHITAGSLGLVWRPVKVEEGSYFEVSDKQPLEVAVRGRLCILTEDGALMREMLGQLSKSGSSREQNKKSTRKAETKPDAEGATLIAGFNLPQERASFVRWSGIVDKTNSGSVAQDGGAGGTGGEPSFFSRNMGGLGDVFAALESERVVERKDGELTRQTVTYAWRH